MPLEPGGRLQFSRESGASGDGEVKEVDPPRRLVFTWGGDMLEFELEPLPDEGRGPGCLLRFTAAMSEDDKVARDAAGWHVCLDRLGAWIAGANASAPTSEPTADWRGLYEDYAARGFATGAPIPVPASSE
jgi:hypothetical protein